MEIIAPKDLTKRERAALRYVVAMLNNDYYFEQYYQLVGDLSPVEAFQANERALFDMCGANRYEDFESFRQMRRRYVKRLGLQAKRNK
jgi:hypothetical protein